MQIGLDWDDTYTRDPIGWDMFIKLMISRGHYVYIVTWRDEEEAKEIYEQLGNTPVEGVFATNRKAKAKFMFDLGIMIDVVVDDNPASWTQSMQPYAANGLWE